MAVMPQALPPLNGREAPGPIHPELLEGDGTERDASSCRCAILLQSANSGVFGAIQAAASTLRVEVSPSRHGSAAVIERGITNFAGAPNSGIISPYSITTLRYGNVLFNLRRA